MKSSHNGQVHPVPRPTNQPTEATQTKSVLINIAPFKIPSYEASPEFSGQALTTPPLVSRSLNRDERQINKYTKETGETGRSSPCLYYGPIKFLLSLSLRIHKRAGYPFHECPPIIIM